MPVRERADLCAHLLGHPARDEQVDSAVAGDRSESRVARPHELSDTLHDELEHAIHVELARDRAARAVERGQRVV